MKVRYFDFTEPQRRHPQEYRLPKGWTPFQVDTSAGTDGMTVRVWAKKHHRD